MPIGQAAAMAFMGLAFLAIWRSKGDFVCLAGGLATFGSTAVAVTRDGLDNVVIAGPISGSFVIAALLIGSLLWADLLGLPTRIALLTGIGLRTQQGVLARAELRRRFIVSWFATLGLALLVVGLGQVGGYSLPTQRIQDAGFLLGLCEIGFGGLALIGCAIVAIRH